MRHPVNPDDLEVKQSASDPDVYVLQLDSAIVAISVGALHKLANASAKRIREREEKRKIDAIHVPDDEAQGPKPKRSRKKAEALPAVRHTHDSQTSGLKRVHRHTHAGGGEEHSHTPESMRSKSVDAGH